MLATIQRQQTRFHYRLFCLRQSQLETARQRAIRAKLQWNEYLQALRKQRQEANRAEEKLNLFLADKTPSIATLSSMIRRLAGLNPRHGRAEVVHDENKSGGPVGYRVCGQNSWDNSVRALDEDR